MLQTIPVKGPVGFHHHMINGQLHDMRRFLVLVPVGALITRIGLWGALYYNYNEGAPKNSIGNS